MKNRKLLMIPGPTPVLRSIQDEMGRETVAFGDSEFVADFQQLVNDLKELWSCDGMAFVVAASGTFAMEMALVNNLKRGDALLIVSNGFFGDRFIEIAKKKGYVYDVLSAPWGQVVSPEQIAKQLKNKKYDAVTVTHVDTSTGAVAPVHDIGQVMKDYPETIYIVDGVCSVAGEPVDMKKDHIDVLFSGSQKAFGVAPGLALLWAGKKSLERRDMLPEVIEYYADYKKWAPIMDDTKKYFATPAVNMTWAMKKSVDIIKEEGLENRYARHRKNAGAMRAALEAMGFTILADPSCRAVTLSNPLYPEGVEDLAFRTELEKQGVQVAGGLGEYAGKMFRIGHMGNVDEHELAATVCAMEKTLKKLVPGYEVGKGITAFLEYLCS
jgi:aspartate aminotransferase-like enzyme